MEKTRTIAVVAGIIFVSSPAPAQMQMTATEEGLAVCTITAMRLRERLTAVEKELAELKKEDGGESKTPRTPGAPGTNLNAPKK
jgi:hypothetical protein